MRQALEVKVWSGRTPDLTLSLAQMVVPLPLVFAVRKPATVITTAPEASWVSHQGPQIRPTYSHNSRLLLCLPRNKGDQPNELHNELPNELRHSSLWTYPRWLQRLPRRVPSSTGVLIWSLGERTSRDCGREPSSPGRLKASIWCRQFRPAKTRLKLEYQCPFGSMVSANVTQVY